MEFFDEEFDLIKIIETLRQTDFMASIYLKRHQRALLTNFQKNTVSDLSWTNWWNKRAGSKHIGAGDGQKEDSESQKKVGPFECQWADKLTSEQEV